jgi:hypothetical protein
MAKTVVTLLLLGLSFGCARYGFEVMRPQELAGHAGSKEPLVFDRPPLQYELFAVENRLVMHVRNQSDDTIQLLGDRSSVVDPLGQSHPLTAISIAPQSFVKLIFPPLRPRLYRTGPSFGIGVGTYVGDGRHRRYYDEQWYHDEPRYFTVVGGADEALYWSWDGESDIRVMLVFSRGEGKETFTHEFVIRRVKV